MKLLMEKQIGSAASKTYGEADGGHVIVDTAKQRFCRVQRVEPFSYEEEAVLRKLCTPICV